MIRKHIKLFRKFLGNIARPRFGWKKKVTKLLKFPYLLIMWPIEVLGDILFFWKRAKRSAIKDPRRILIVKIDQFGDVLFSTFLLPIIKRKYPNLEIDYLVNPKTKPLLEKNPHIANVYFWENILLLSLLGREKAKTGGIFSIIRKNKETLRLLKARTYDAVINTRSYPPSSNIPWRRIGGPLIAFDISEQSFLADYWADYDLDEEEWKNYLNLLRPIGIDGTAAECKEEFFNLGKNPMSGKEPYAVISPVSFDPERQWNDENWKKLIKAMQKKNIGIAVTGIKGHEEYIDRLLPEDKKGVNIFTSLSLPDFGALMAGARFFAGIDSFPAHLAIACGTKAFIFVSPGAYFIKNLSKKRFAVDARMMIPAIRTATLLDVKIGFEEAEKAITS
ncbi:glycosyltransferase family 9 protein [Patescibacteria group bacterium]|nr:glycosyltransferase family 9 protein [Patescibacteria group bacterium]MCL5114554.1 glycosyltransferase family 9 protein [Patescibacteria group bacterium]